MLSGPQKKKDQFLTKKKLKLTYYKHLTQKRSMYSLFCQ